MSIETERLVHDQAPSPEQLRKLAFIGVKSAVQRESLRTLSRGTGAHYFIDEVDLLGDVHLVENVPVQVRHRLAMRVGVRPPEGNIPKVWSLKFFDTYSVEATPGVWQAERSIYRFEWTRSRALMADRTIRLFGLGEPAPEELDEYLDKLSFPDDAVEMLAASEDLRLVTTGDCDELTSDIASYLSVVEGLSSRA